MKKLFVCLAAGAAALFVMVAPAQAQTGVSVPWGDAVSAAAAWAWPVVVAGLGLLWRKVPSGLAGWLRQKQVDAALEKAVQYGFNTVAGAQKGKTLTVELGSAVLASAAAYAMANFPGLVASQLGGLTKLRDKLIARITELPPESGGSIPAGKV